MNTVVLRLQTDLDPSAAPRVFGYLGGLGHIPVQAALRRNSRAELVMEVQFESPLAAAKLICAKMEQMPFVLTSDVTDANPAGGAASAVPETDSQTAIAIDHGGMQHAPAALPCPRDARLDVASLCSTAAQRSRAVHHRSWLQRGQF